MRFATEIVLTSTERTTLEKWSKGRSTPMRLVQRARIVLLAAQGQLNRDIAQTLQMTRKTVGLWRSRFAQLRLAGITQDAPRAGRPATKRSDQAERILHATLHTKPEIATHWSVRSLAQHLGVTPTMVHRVWRAHQLQPHRTKYFKLSNDPHFIDKLIDVVGLYLSPPEHALVLSCDEKSQIQALERSQKSLPLYPGRLNTLTHDYARHGTTTLFAALNMAEGKLITQCMPRHRHQEWLQFLKKIDAETPPGLDLHLIVDNYATHKHHKVQRWIQRHPRFHMHFIPTSSSWLNVVERWFRELTQKCLKRNSFQNVSSLIQTIEKFVQHHNDHPKAITWTASVGKILRKVTHAHEVLNKYPSE